MPDDILDAAARDAARELHGTGRAWVRGLGRFVDAFDTPGAQPGELEQLLEDARELFAYPTGRLAYVPGGPEVVVQPTYDAAHLRSPHGSEPVCVGMVGIGTAGFVAASASCGETNTPEASRVLLPEIEATLVDTLALASLRALQLGYGGALTVRVDVVDATVAGDARLWLVDEDTGEERETDVIATTVRPLRIEADTSMTHEHLHALAFDQARALAESVGATAPQLIPLPGSPQAVADITERYRRMRARGLEVPTG